MIADFAAGEELARRRRGRVPADRRRDADRRPGRRSRRIGSGEGTFALTYADGVADVDLGAALDFHRAHGAAATVTLVRPHSQWGVAMLDGDDRISGFVEKPRMEQWVNAGFFFLEPAALGYLETGLGPRARAARAARRRRAAARVPPRGLLGLHGHLQGRGAAQRPLGVGVAAVADLGAGARSGEDGARHRRPRVRRRLALPGAARARRRGRLARPADAARAALDAGAARDRLRRGRGGRARCVDRDLLDRVLADTPSTPSSTSPPRRSSAPSGTIPPAASTRTSAAPGRCSRRAARAGSSGSSSPPPTRPTARTTSCPTARTSRCGRRRRTRRRRPPPT